MCVCLRVQTFEVFILYFMYSNTTTHMKTSQDELDPFQFFISYFIVILNKVFYIVEKDIYVKFVTHK